MQLLQTDLKKGIVTLRITDKDDLWYLSHIIELGDRIAGETTRKVKIGEGDNATVTKRTICITIEAETIELTETADVLRINGKIKDGPEDIPKESYHALELEENTEWTITKKQWLEYQKQKLLEATEKKYTYLFCIFDREEAILAITKKSSYETLVHLRGDVTKKYPGQESKKDFYQEIITLLKEYAQRYQPEQIIIASPAFYKEDLVQKIPDSELKKKIALATCSDVSEAAFDEVLRRPELTSILKNNRAKADQAMIEELLHEISTQGLAAYGWEEIQALATTGIIKTLLLTDNFIAQHKKAGNFTIVDSLLKTIDVLQGKIHLLSSDNESGKRLDGLGGIAALLRYKASW